MDTKIQAALSAPYPHWPLIVTAGLCPAIVAGVVEPGLFVPTVIVAVMLQIVVFGRILAQVVPERTTAFWGILKEYSPAYVIAGLTLGIVTFALLFAVMRTTSWLPFEPARGIVLSVVAAATVYVWPLVFLRRSGFEAIPAGVTYLVRNFASSLWIVGITVVGQVLQTAGDMVYREHRSGPAFAVVLVAGIVFLYLVAVAFAAALHTLLRAMPARTGG